MDHRAVSESQAQHQPIQLVADDPWLEPHEPAIRDRMARLKSSLSDIDREHGSLAAFANEHRKLGFHRDHRSKAWRYREWAPRAEQLWLVGDFNEWCDSHPLSRLEDNPEVWQIAIPDDKSGTQALRHLDRVKVRIKGGNGMHDRLPAMIRFADQNPDTHDFAGRIWDPPQPFAWSDENFDLSSIGPPLIYECHVGMAQEKEGIGTYREFEENVLPRIAALGYNCIQIMAVQEHPYYASFGYHVSNYFAPSSRFGNPDDLKSLINAAHRLGIAVLLDIVHSHAVKNFAEGLAEFDGADGQYFHTGERGYHSGWDSRLFDYGKPAVQQFLLSNVRYWIEEFHFDGFRFDGVTSMLYWHHGEGVAFDHYAKYFEEGVEWDAVLYLQLATTLAHSLKPGSILIAEDMSGMPGLCRPIEEGGIGFDYRLGMGIPDYWIKLLKHSRDEDWSMADLWGTLTNRRKGEKTVAYAESHDQALVGDKTLAFWLMDKDMYWMMNTGSECAVIDRGIALHKMIRLITLVLGGEAYLNFIGNEFGHPEWVDFPREGNDWSFQHARRQWSLVDNRELRYQHLNAFDREMLRMATAYSVLASEPAVQLHVDEKNNILIVQRAGLIWAFNFHPTRSIPDYAFSSPRGW